MSPELRRVAGIPSAADRQTSGARYRLTATGSAARAGSFSSR